MTTRFDLRKLLAAVDLGGLAEREGAKFEGRKNGRELRGTCPIHGGDNPTAFVIYQDNDGLARWHCYTTCASGGDAIGLVMKLRNLEFIEAVRYLAGYAHLSEADLGLTVERIAEIEADRRRTDVLDMAAEYFAAQLWGEAGCGALAYARSRGFSDDLIRLAGWGFADGSSGLQTALRAGGADYEAVARSGLVRADGSDFTANAEGRAASPSGYLVFPHRRQSPGAKLKPCATCQADTWHTYGKDGACLRHVQGRGPLVTPGTTYFSSRALAPVIPADKARNLPGPRQLYKAEVPGDRSLTLVEGVPDAESLRQWGYSAWALCGLGEMPEADLDLLRQRTPVYPALDADPAGAGSLPKLAQAVGPLAMLHGAFPGGKDANAFLQSGGERAQVEALRAAAGTWLDRRLAASKQAAAPALPAIIEEIAGLLYRLPNALKTRYYREAGQILKIGREELVRLANGYQAGGDGLLNLASIKDGQLCFLGDPLGNFSARITRELIREQGTGIPEVEYTIQGRLANGEALVELVVPAAEFGSLGWLASWGARAILYLHPGKGFLFTRAMQELSVGELVRERVFEFTGWTEINGEWGFLSAAGFLTAEGLDESVRVDLGQNNLRHYALPVPPRGPDLKKAVRASLDFLEIGPRTVTAPLWAAIFAAPFTEIKPLYTVLWVYGSTRSGKTTVSHLALTHYGPGFIEGRQHHAPEGWETTMTSLEGSMFITKDVPIIIDDYAPQMASAADARDMGKKAQKVIRSVGNRAARGRSLHNLKQRETRPPRGLVLATAELPLPGESTVGRMLFVPIGASDVMPEPGAPPNARLDQAQADGEGGLYAQANAAYIQWLAANWPRACALFLEVLDETSRMVRSGEHSLQNRLPDTYAYLVAGQQVALTAFFELGVLSTADVLEISQINEAAILSVVKSQAERVAAESPVRKFFEALDNLIERQKVYLAPRAQEVPCTPPIGADLVGYYDAGNPQVVYLNDDSCLMQVRAYWLSMGENFDTTREALRRQFVQIRGLLERTGPGANIALQMRARGKRTWLLVFNTQKITSLYGRNIRHDQLDMTGDGKDGEGDFDENE